MAALQAGAHFFPSHIAEIQTTNTGSKHTLFQGAKYLWYFLPCWQGIKLKELQLDVSTVLKSLSVFKRSICTEALMQLKISTRIWQKSQCRKMADSCAMRCLLVHCFYLWQLLLHLISSAVFEAFTKNNYSFHKMDLLYPPNRALIHIFLWQHPVVIRAVFIFAGLHSLGH